MQVLFCKSFSISDTVNYLIEIVINVFFNEQHFIVYFVQIVIYLTKCINSQSDLPISPPSLNSLNVNQNLIFLISVNIVLLKIDFYSLWSAHFYFFHSVLN